MKAVGIHLGFTNCRVCYADDSGTAIPVPVKGRRAFATAVWCGAPGAEMIVGCSAKARAGREPFPILGIPRYLGTDAIFDLGGQHLNAADICTHLLIHARKLVEEACGDRISDIALAVPAWSDMGFKKDLYNAAVAAFFEGNDSAAEGHLLLTLEPQAAVRAISGADLEATGRVLVYQWGGARFEASVLDGSSLTIDGDPNLGGSDLDQRIASWILAQLSGYGIDDSAGSRAWQVLLSLAERVKSEFAHSSQAVIVEPAAFEDHSGDPVDLDLVLTRADFDRLSSDLVSRTVEIAIRAVERAGLKHHELDRILLCGGSSQLPMVREHLESAFNRPLIIEDPQLTVVRGAALEAYGSSRKLFSIDLGDPAMAYARFPEAGLDAVFPNLPKASPEVLERAVEGLPFEEVLPIKVKLRADLSFIRGRLPEVDRRMHGLGFSTEVNLPRKLGPYCIEDVAGTGAFTVVCVARDETSFMDRRMALKIPLQQDLGQIWLDRIRTEAKVWKLLSDGGHPNILVFEDLKRVDGYTFFVMEHMDGGNLEEALSKIPAVEKVGRLIKALEAIAEGLAFAHGRNAIHGDIKPQNILVSADWTSIKLGDFGLAFLLVDNEDNGAQGVTGTTMFLSPESFDGIRSTQTDIYALGVTLYYLLTGQYPFSQPLGDLAGDELRRERLAFDPKPFPADLEVPEWLETVVHRALAPHPQDRFRDAAELLEFLVPYVNPAKMPMMVLTAWWNAEDHTLHYHAVAPTEAQSSQMLSVEVTQQTLRCLCAEWKQVGRLIEQRGENLDHGISPLDIDEQTRNLLSGIAEDGAHFLLGPKVREMLQSRKGCALWLQHDPRLTVVPWELLAPGRTPLCRMYAMSRSPKLIQARPSRLSLGPAEKIRILIVGDPCGDLQIARDECLRIRVEFESSPLAHRFEVDLVTSPIDSYALRRRLRQCDILHFAGHVVFPDRRGGMDGCGFLLGGALDKPETWDVLRATSLDALWGGAPPAIVFANACGSGRASPESIGERVTHDSNMGLAQAFLSAGVAAYLGATCDPPDSESTCEFATSFYHELSRGGAVSQAVLSARTRCATKFGEDDLTWARYVLFGHPLTHISIGG